MDRCLGGSYRYNRGVKSLVLATAALALSIPGWGQGNAPAGADDPIVVSTQHPRLFLRPQRLRLLKRERERESIRWEQFHALISTNAPLAEPGFAQALYYAIAGEREVGTAAVQFALGPEADLRQTAIVYDWCQDVMSDAEKKALAAKMVRALGAPPPAATDFAAQRSRVLAAVALFDETPQLPGKELERVVRTWWAGSITPALKAGRHIVERDDAYPLWELFHALRDSTNIDLRESAPKFFTEFPIEHLLSYYPLPFPGPDGLYFIGAEAKTGDPDLHLAALSRAAEMAMVAFDSNAPESQVLQGWIMHDKYLMKGSFGLPYEFIWANPYQPGLSYYHVPLVYYAPEYGRLFIRSSWDDDADWFAAFDGIFQKFGDGGPVIIDASKPQAPLPMKEATIFFARGEPKFQIKLEEPQALFLTGLDPQRVYQVEVDDEEMFEAPADRAGILELDFVPAAKPIGIRIRPLARATN